MTYREPEIWIVLDGDEPDSKVIGCARDLDGCLELFSEQFISVEGPVINLRNRYEGFIATVARPFDSPEAPTPRFSAIRKVPVA